MLLTLGYKSGELESRYTVSSSTLLFCTGQVHLRGVKLYGTFSSIISFLGSGANKIYIHEEQSNLIQKKIKFFFKKTSI